MQTTHAHSRLEHMPISLFATVMGLAGLTIATQKAEQAWGLGQLGSNTLIFISFAVYTVIFLAYFMKWIKYPLACQSACKNDQFIG